MKFQNIWLGSLGKLGNLERVILKFPKFLNRSPNRSSLRMT